MLQPASVMQQKPKTRIPEKAVQWYNETAGLVRISDFPVLTRTRFTKPDETDRLEIQYWMCKDRNEVYGLCYFGQNCEGPPAHAHGGSIGTVLDEALGMTANFLIGDPSVIAVVAQLQVWMRKPVAVGKTYMFEASLQEHVPSQRKIVTKASIFCFSSDMPPVQSILQAECRDLKRRVVYAEGRAVLVKVPFKHYDPKRSATSTVPWSKL